MEQQQPDDQTLKMEALKKAYADMILNTSKEAAARVMASERKALRFQHDLRNAKDEALRMLLRFKHMLDLKTSETEKANLDQQKRIEELDAQLNEAEGVIVDLRAELRSAYEKLEEMKNRHMLQSNGPSENEDMSRENATHDKKLDAIEGLEEMKNSHMLPSNGASENAHMDQEKTAHDKKRDVIEILEELKNNHMLQATGQSESNCIHQENIPHAKKLYIAKRLEELKKNHVQLSHGLSENEQTRQEDIALDKKLDVSDQFICSSEYVKCFTRAKEPATSAPKLASIVNGNREPESYRNGCTHRIRAIAEITDTKSINRPEAVSIHSSVVKDQAVKVKLLPRNRVRYAKSKRKLSRFCNAPSIKSIKRTERLNLKENTRVDEKLTETNGHGACGIRRSIRKRKLRCWDEISSLFKSRSALSRCKRYSGSNGVKFDECQYRSKFTDASKETKCDEDSKLVDVSVVGVASCNSMAAAEIVLKTDSEQTRDTDKSRDLKYTFSRKRKNVLSCKLDNSSSPEKTCLTGENEKLNMIDDSIDSENLVEVACQLISLSGEHSW
uniref:uncharacterized protein LOC122605944 n=1 Tax=Erigeron canadensis TaxID=72917 RepID=UPI001CB89FB0|nr:uncharacterized protein LOC122605944 [Erigeron canadensis]